MTAKAETAEKTEKAEKEKTAETAKKAARTKKAETAEKTEKAARTGKTGTAKKTARAGRTKKTEKPGQAESGEQDLTRGDIIGRYLEIYRRCMTDDPKSFDARGAAHALEQISKLLGLTVSAKDTDGNEIVLTLSEEADALGQ